MERGVRSGHGMIQVQWEDEVAAIPQNVARVAREQRLGKAAAKHRVVNARWAWLSEC
jgi:hypothetical protein